MKDGIFCCVILQVSHLHLPLAVLSSLASCIDVIMKSRIAQKLSCVYEGLTVFPKRGWLLCGSLRCDRMPGTIPANFRQQFHFSQILPPDVEVLSQIVLSALGFSQGGLLSRKLSIFCKLAKLSVDTVEVNFFTSSSLIALLKDAQHRLRSFQEQDDEAVSNTNQLYGDAARVCQRCLVLDLILS